MRLRAYGYGGSRGRALDAIDADGPADVLQLALTEVDSYLVIDAKGTVTLYSGKVDLGTGVETALAQMAAEELEYCMKRLGFRGVEIGTNVVGQEISRGRDAFWAKAQELDAMVFMHPNGFTGGERLSDHYFINIIGNPLDSTVAIAHLVFDGILERYPKLKIVSAHGGGYVSHYPARMDHAWSARVDPRTVLKTTPRRSLAKLYFDTIVFDREQLRHLVNLWGADHIVVGTDYPYDMGWYDPRGFVDGCAFLKDGDRAKILGLNAARLLKLKPRRAR